MVTCGERGGLTKAGKPCGRRSWRDGQCAQCQKSALGGRPPIEITDEQVAQVEKLAGILTQEQLADFLGIAERTLRDKFRADPRVSAAYARGRAKSIGAVARNLVQQALEGDSNAMRFYLATQAGWKETTRSEITGKDGGPVKTEDVTKAPDDELRARAAQLVNRLSVSRN